MNKFTDKTLSFRKAERTDVPLILEFIRELADYEHMRDEVVATPELQEKWIFGERKAEVVFAAEDGQEAGGFMRNSSSQWAFPISA